MVQQIKELETQLESLTLADLEKLGQVSIQVEEPRPDERIVACVAVRPRCVRNKCGGAYPHPGIQILDIRITYDVRPVLPDSGQRVVGAGYRTVRKSRMRAEE